MFSIPGHYGDRRHEPQQPLTLRANVAPGLDGTFFTLDLARVRCRFRGGAMGAPRGGAAASFRTACRWTCRSTWQWPIGARSQELRLLNSYGEVFEANVGEVEQDDTAQAQWA